jgi:hypothetical protein
MVVVIGEAGSGIGSAARAGPVRVQGGGSDRQRIGQIFCSSWSCYLLAMAMGMLGYLIGSYLGLGVEKAVTLLS